MFAPCLLCSVAIVHVVPSYFLHYYVRLSKYSNKCISFTDYLAKIIVVSDPTVNRQA